MRKSRLACQKDKRFVINISRNMDMSREINGSLSLSSSTFILLHFQLVT